MPFFNREAMMPRKALAWTLVPALLLGALLFSGCGGGSSTTTSEGFRFVPDGQGDVIPVTGLDFRYTLGSVSSGVVVSAVPVAPISLPTPLPAGETTSLAAYQVRLSAPSVTFTPQAQVFLTYDPKSAPLNSSPRIYLYDPNLKTWQALPITQPFTTSPAQAQLPSTLSSGSYLAVFAGGPPTTLNPFFGNYIISYAGSANGSFSLAIDNNGAVTGASLPANSPGSVTITSGSVSSSGAISFLTSAGTTFTGTLVSTGGAVTLAASPQATWTGPGPLAGTWSLP